MSLRKREEEEEVPSDALYIPVPTAGLLDILMRGVPGGVARGVIGASISGCVAASKLLMFLTVARRGTFSVALPDSEVFCSRFGDIDAGSSFAGELPDMTSVPEVMTSPGTTIPMGTIFGSVAGSVSDKC